MEEDKKMICTIEEYAMELRAIEEYVHTKTQIPKSQENDLPEIQLAECSRQPQPCEKTRKLPMPRKYAWSEENDDTKRSPLDTIYNLIVLAVNSMNKNLTYILNQLIRYSQGLPNFYGVFIPAVAVLFTTLITLLPQHDVILNPKYWYEFLLPTNFGFAPIATATTLIEYSIVMRRDQIWSLNVFLKLFLSTSLGFTFTYVSIYVTWVHLLKYRHPMPFIGHCCLISTYILKCTTLWFLFPSNLRINNKQYRHRLVAYLSTFPLSILIGVGYSNISSLFFRIPLDMQWSMGLILPLFKEFIMFTYAKVLNKATGGDKLSTKIMTICCVGSVHSFSIALLLGSNVTSTTAYLVMFLDCIPNIRLFQTVMRLHHQGTRMAKAEQNVAFTCLALKEYFELAIPLAYCASFVVAYYGPNANILGNVQNDYWQYKKVENVVDRLRNNGIFFVIDALRGVMFGLFLWRFCRLNMFKRHCDNIRQYKILILTNMTGILTLVMNC